MSGFLKKIGSLFAYKEPKNKELGFELLEDNNEGNEAGGSAAPAPALAPPAQESQPRRKRAARKRPTPGGDANTDAAAPAQPAPAQPEPAQSQPPQNQDIISPDLNVSREIIRQKFNIPRNSDVIIRELYIGRKVKAFIVVIENIVDINQLNRNLLPYLMDKDVFGDVPPQCQLDYLIENVIALNHVTKTNMYTDAVKAVLYGGAALFVQGCSECALFNMRGAESRAVSKPVTEFAVKGAQEAFTESIKTNISLIRKIINNQSLIVEAINVGTNN
ncbi:MAG TPA: spore germination protein, partial [Clostridia bacterium]|nr:spore germination protein [Clostridia bacterium]